MTDTPDTNGWAWWAGRDEEYQTVGPCSTREEAIEAAIDAEFNFEWANEEKTRFSVRFNVCEARNEPLRLADWLVDDPLEYAEDQVWNSDRTSSEYDDGPFFKCTPEQEEDLRERLRRACDEWQAEHGLVFKCHTFSDVRSGEWVTAERDVEPGR